MQYRKTCTNIVNVLEFIDGAPRETTKCLAKSCPCLTPFMNKLTANDKDNGAVPTPTECEITFEDVTTKSFIRLTAKWEEEEEDKYVRLISDDSSVTIDVKQKKNCPQTIIVCIECYFYQHKPGTHNWYSKKTKRANKIWLRNIIESIVVACPSETTVDVCIPCDLSKIPPDRPFAGFPLYRIRTAQGRYPFYMDCGFIPLKKEEVREVQDKFLATLKDVQDSVNAPVGLKEALKILIEMCGMKQADAKGILDDFCSRHSSTQSATEHRDKRKRTV